ncbi:MAG TPA: universal stress protein [Solirubrobacteraceae bacterium]|nr:universal stress protein [Solirubrobacteraceae bacterium]
MADTIVVGTDGSDSAKRAVAEAVHIAEALHAELHIVSAFEPLHAHRQRGAPEGATPYPDSEVDAILEDAKSEFRDAGVKTVTHATEDDHPADALLRVATEVGASLIVVGNRGMHSGLKRFVLGSVPDKVSHHARCNVLIVATDRE